MKVEDWFHVKGDPDPALCIVFGCKKKRQGTGRLCPRHGKQFSRANNPVLDAYANLRDNAKRRRKEFTLTLEQFIEWATTTGYMDKKGRQRHHYHIDRIDPSKGYTIDNIQPLTCSENTAKGNTERCPF